MDLRTLLAAILGIGLGVLFLGFPGVVVQVHTAGRLPRDRGGHYGDDSGSSQGWRRIVQGVGLAMIVFGLYLATTLA